MANTTHPRPADAVACVTLGSSRTYGMFGEASAHAIQHLYDGSRPRASAHLRALQAQGLVTGEKNSLNRAIYWTLTDAGLALCAYASAVCKCGADVERDLDDLCIDLCRSCLADLTDKNAERYEEGAESSREIAALEDTRAQMLRARAETLRWGGGVLLGEEEA